MPPLTRLALKNKSNLPKVSIEPEPKKRRVGIKQNGKKLSSSFDVKPVIKALPEEVPIFDFDSKQATNPDAVAHFALDIFRYLKYQEEYHQLSDYISRSYILDRHRALVVDWLCECQEAYSFTHETLYISVKLFDTFMSKNPETTLNSLQLVAGTSFLVAAKYEEYEPPRVNELVEFCNDMFTRNEFLAMERGILTAARGNLGFPLSYSFLRRFARAINTSMIVLTTARFALEASMHYYKYAVQETPSKMAAASLVLAINKNKTGSTAWVPHLEHYSGWKLSELHSLVVELDAKVLGFRQEFPKCKHVVEKYSDSNFFEVAKRFFYNDESG